MKIKKTSPTAPVQAQVVNNHSTSTTDSYSANYVNNHSHIIKEQGTSGIWEYIKYEDGTAICRCIYEWDCTGWEAWGNVYTSKSNGANNYAIPPDFPFEFEEIPHLSIEFVNSNTNNILSIMTRSDGPTTITPTAIKYVRPTVGVGATMKTSYLAIGKWKQEEQQASEEN